MTSATVRSWAAGVGGSALLDDGSVVVLGPECLRDSVFRFLRLGQRIRVELSEGHVTSVSLP